MDAVKATEQVPPTIVVAEHSTLLGFLTDILEPLQRQTWSPLLPLPILATLHAIKVTFDYRKRLRSMSGRHPPLVQGLFTVLTMALGGSTSAAVLMGLPPSWLSSNATLPTYAIVYLAMFRAPGDIAFRFLESFESFIRPVLLLADGLTRANAQASFAIESVRAMPTLQDSIVAQLLCGTLAGCGGGILADAFNLTAADWGLRTPAAFKEEQYDLRVSLITTLTYAMTTLNTSQQVTHADSILARLSPSTMPSTGFIVLDSREAKCLAGLLFTSAQLWRHYSSLMLGTTKGRHGHVAAGARKDNLQKQQELAALSHESDEQDASSMDEDNEDNGMKHDEHEHDGHEHEHEQGHGHGHRRKKNIRKRNKQHQQQQQQQQPSQE